MGRSVSGEGTLKKAAKQDRQFLLALTSIEKILLMSRNNKAIQATIATAFRELLLIAVGKLIEVSVLITMESTSMLIKERVHFPLGSEIGEDWQSPINQTLKCVFWELTLHLVHFE